MIFTYFRPRYIVTLASNQGKVRASECRNHQKHPKHNQQVCRRRRRKNHRYHIVSFVWIRFHQRKSASRTRVFTNFALVVSPNG